MQGIVIAVFLFEGITKLTSVEFQVAGFIRWGYPAWLRYLIGVCELLGAVGMMTRLRNWAAAGLTIILLGAIYTHISRGEPQMMGLAVVTVILIIVSTILKKKANSSSTVVQ